MLHFVFVIVHSPNLSNSQCLKAFPLIYPIIGFTTFRFTPFIFGDMAGFFGDYKDGRKWLITEVSIKDQTASLSIINDYGSEDLTAELSVTPEGKYIFKQLKGSTMKIARNRKWLKLPKTLEFIRR